MKELLELWIVFFKLGLFTFGGGYAMIPQLKEKVVEDKKWLTDDQILMIISIAESTPGPIAINMATFVGYQRKGFWGSFLATLGVVMPSFIIILLISLVLEQFMNNQYVEYAFTGIKCAVGILILKAALNMFIKSPKKIGLIMIFSIVTILMIVFELLEIKFSSIYFIIIGGILGIITNSIAHHQTEVEK